MLLSKVIPLFKSNLGGTQVLLPFCVSYDSTLQCQDRWM